MQSDRDCDKHNKSNFFFDFFLQNHEKVPILSGDLLSHVRYYIPLKSLLIYVNKNSLLYISENIDYCY